MTTEATGTLPENSGDVSAEEQAAQDAAKAAAETATEGEAGETLTEEQKAAKAEEDRKAEEAARKAKTQANIDRKINLAKAEAAKEREARQKLEVDKARIEGELEAYRKLGTKGEPQPDPNAPPVKPNIEDFETMADYNGAILDYTDKLTDWKIQNSQTATKKELEELRRTAAPAGETPEQKRARETKERINTTLERVATEFGEDIAETLQQMPPNQLTPLMRDEIFEKGDNAPKMFAFLAENPKVAEKIAALNLAGRTGEVIREIDRLEQSIMKKPQPTNAPPPNTDVKGSPVVQVDEAKMSDEEWFKYRRQKKLSSA